MTTVSVAQTRPTVLSNVGRHRHMSPAKHILSQIFCIAVALTVLFPLFWVVSMSLNNKNVSRPDLVPRNIDLSAYTQVLNKPTENPVSFFQLALNSLEISAIVMILSLVLGSLAAYAFSRLRFTGRQVLMVAVLAVLMLPSIAALSPLFVLLNQVRFGTYNLRDSIPGVALAVTAGTLPFAIWNMKGYIDTIPRELEEAAAVDGASKAQIFIWIILPLARPVLAVTAFFGFLAGWTEFFFSWVFLDHPGDFTLSMALNGMVGQYGTTPWSQFAAFSVLVALPVTVVYLVLQRYIVSGLTIGSVK